MKVDTADSKGKWLVGVPIRLEALASRSGLEFRRAWTESARSPRRVRERPQIDGKSREKLRSELNARKAEKPKWNWGFEGLRSYEAGGQGQDRTADLRFFRPLQALFDTSRWC